MPPRIVKLGHLGSWLQLVLGVVGTARDLSGPFQTPSSEQFGDTAPPPAAQCSGRSTRLQPTCYRLRL